MIDNIKIRLNKFSGDLAVNCNKSKKDGVNPKTGEEYEIWYLPGNKFGRTPHDLMITKGKKTGRVNVKGSLRKWAINKATVHDLTSGKVEQTLKKIAEKLVIPYEELCKATFTQCELGLTFNSRKPCKMVIPMMKRYNRIYRARKPYYHGETVYFIGAKKNLKLYDKGKEIIDHTDDEDLADKRREMFDKLKKIKHLHFLRLEFTLKNHSAFTLEGMPEIRTVGDLVANYSRLYEFWCSEVYKILLFNPAGFQFDSPDMNEYEREITISLRRYGYEDTLVASRLGIEALEDVAESSKRTMITNEVKEIERIIRKYNPKSYNDWHFRCDIWKELIKISKKDPALNIKKAFRALSGIPF